MAGNIHNHAGGVTGWFKSVASTISGAFKKGGFLHFKSIRKTQPKSSWRMPAPDRNNTPAKKAVGDRKIAPANRDQVHSIKTPDAQKKTKALLPQAREKSSFQQIRDKQLALLQTRQKERQDTVAAYKKACDRKGVSIQQARSEGLFPELTTAWGRAKRLEKTAQDGLDRLDEMSARSASRK